MAAALVTEGLPRFRAFVGLGANLGPARENLQAALLELRSLPWTTLEGVSSFYVTKAVGTDGPDYLNAVAALSTSLAPLELLNALLAVELKLGRERPRPLAPRTLDLDLLWMEGAMRESETLTLPHPRMTGRAFVQEPLAELLGQLPQKSTDPQPLSTSARAELAASQGISLE
ncbi:2-amino-4-hydroxy-6-hydroxymethyldihydropteridine diphosphokinase [Aquabacterium sp.]|uniref:2-amino-4-hydroxy-6- hydroxymethyldihydropteridine diphosphokinase n=1 Tax=Aquabacterium sp. TaxID=1872578 RepID=UPI002489FE20|nr:2-amino-4-hydroxy-6-hydroxymethyldihydropteridine diphosphokinase [Aquabacterium sp.]MDI1258878.1 2-amino-4-hydroxy-6-hydroxymethyldihydropteridine diphosphokinase [Aquabacterium sp.]